MTSAKMVSVASVDAAGGAFEAIAVKVALAEKPVPFTMVIV
jgi:hypothetical protein